MINHEDTTFVTMNEVQKDNVYIDNDNSQRLVFTMSPSSICRDEMDKEISM